MEWGRRGWKRGGYGRKKREGRVNGGVKTGWDGWKGWMVVEEGRVGRGGEGREGCW